MSLDLGELAGRLMLDIGPLKRDVEASKTELRSVVSSAEDAGSDAGGGFSHNWGDSAKKGAVAAGAAFGTAVVVGLHGAMEREASGARLAAQLGLSPAQQERMGRIAGQIYAGAYGDSIDQVNEALAAVHSSLGKLNGQELHAATRDALNYASTFDVDVARSVQIVGQLIRTGLVKDARAGFDLVIAASQHVPAAIREDLLDAADEYGQFFAGLGYSGQQTFGILVDASAKGMYGLDKAGDAVKEFTIRATDGSDLTQTAMKRIGLSANDMADDILAGGNRAHDATQKIIKGILDIEDPAKRAQTALSLFGTPLEDLNTADIPKFLQGLQDTGHRLDDVKGSAHRVNKELGSTADADFTKLKRRLENDLIGVMEKALPIIEDDIVPAIEDIGGALEKIPSWAIKGSLGGLLGLYAAGKLGSLFSDLRGLKGGVAGGLGGSVASKAAPVPVWVVNEMPGGGVPGAGGTAVTGSGKGAMIAKATLGLGALYLGGEAFKNSGIPQNMSSKLFGTDDNSDMSKALDGDAAAVERIRAQLKAASKEWDGFSDNATFAFDMVHDAIDTTLRALPKRLQTEFVVNGIPDSKREVKDLIDQYDLTPSQMKTLFDAAGIPNSIREVQSLIAQQSKVPSQVSTAFHMNGIEAALGQIATLEARIDGLKGRGDHVLPYVHGGQSTPRVKLVVGEREMDAYVDGRTSKQINAQDDWRTAVGG